MRHEPSALSSVASVASSSGSNERSERERSGRSSPTHTAALSSQSTGPAPSASTTSALRGEQLSLLSISSVAASLAKTSVQPARELALLVLGAACGSSLLASSANSDPSGSSLKTLRLVLRAGLMRSATTWDSSAMTHYRSQLAQSMSARRTAATESFLLPTPTAANYGSSNNGDPHDGRGEYATKGKLGLSAMASKGMWPTPTASDARGPGVSATREGGLNLRTAVKLWPTPQARDHLKPHSQEYIEAKRSQGHGMRNLNDAVSGNDPLWATPTVTGNWTRKGASATSGDGLGTQVGGPLNPTWVEYLMGFPAEHTALEPSVMRSFRSARKSSAK